jgi:hypothetical protein
MRKLSFLSACLIICSALILALWAIFRSQQPHTMVVGTDSYTTYFRMKADYTYKSATGPQAWTFDVVGGCGVALTKYITGDISSMSQRVPTVYALPTSDGHALLIEVPRVCGDATTANGRIPKDFFPAIVYYEKADDLSLGQLYLSEDAYEGPNSKLTFHGATISSATKEEFDAWMNGEEKKNLVSLLTSAEIKPLGYWKDETSSELLTNPALYWKTTLPKNCFGVARLKMPTNLKKYVEQFWKKDGPRYWTMERKKADELRNLMGKEPTAVKDGKVENGDVLFNGHAFRNYLVYPTSEAGGWGMGLITRRGGGNFRAVNPTVPQVINALPTDYFPLRWSEGLPWLKNIDRNAKEFVRDVEIGDETKKGIFYCFDINSTSAVMNYYMPSLNPETQTAKFPAKLRVDGIDVPSEVIDRYDRGSLFFDRDEYVLWIAEVLL